MLRFRNQALSLLPVLMAFLSVLSLSAPAYANNKYAAIVVDANTGRTLYAEDADERRFPASLTKMMTLYVLFEELEAKRLTLGSRLSVSVNAARQAPSKLGVRAGTTIKVEDAILALTTKSANDVAVVIAESVEGSVSAFAARMNRTARALGMNSSTFRNPHGLPDAEQTTTARDFVRLATGLQDRFPTYYKYFGAKSFTYKGRRNRNHNRLLGSVQGVDGIKTGYTRASGFNLVTNVRRDGRHIIAVVMGGKTAASRDAQMRQLISKYLPQAKRGSRTADVVIADAVSSEGQEAAAPPAVAAPDLRLPRPRPEAQEEPALAYARTSEPRDVVGALMAQPAASHDEIAAAIAAPADEQGDISSGEGEVASDPIADRISGATEVAELAFVQPQAAPDADAMARLTEVARLRAGRQQTANGDMVALSRPNPTDDGRAADAGWHVQIGAVPTEDGAQALLENARQSMGRVLASLQPVTQEVEKDGTTLYRARFAGLSDKEEARALCAKLQSKSIKCLAVPN